MKRIINALQVSVLAVGMAFALAGCAKKEEPASHTNDPPENPENPDIPPEPPKK